MENQLENEMETGVIIGVHGFNLRISVGLALNCASFGSTGLMRGKCSFGECADPS